jgi:hypothetical protein
MQFEKLPKENHHKWTITDVMCVTCKIHRSINSIIAFEEIETSIATSPEVPFADIYFLIKYRGGHVPNDFHAIISTNLESGFRLLECDNYETPINHQWITSSDVPGENEWLPDKNTITEAIQKFLVGNP